LQLPTGAGWVREYQYGVWLRREDFVNFVFYCSKEGSHLDEGTIVSELLEGKPQDVCYYSNNLVLKDKDGKKRMLVQYSEQHQVNTTKVNIMNAWVECC